MAGSGRSLKCVVVAAVALALAGVAVGGWLLLRPSGAAEAADPTPLPSAESAAPATFPPERARQIETALVAGDEASARSVLAIPAEQPLDAGFTQALAGFEQVTIDDTTFRQDGETAVVDATVTSGGTDVAWALHLVQVDGVWAVAATTPR